MKPHGGTALCPLELGDCPKCGLACCVALKWYRRRGIFQFVLARRYE
jgi:hypothetical protein